MQQLFRYLATGILLFVLVTSCQTTGLQNQAGTAQSPAAAAPAALSEGQALQMALDTYREIMALRNIEWSKIKWGPILDKCNTILALNPEFIDAWSIQAEAYGQLGRHSKALESLQKLIDLQPGKADLYCRLGSTYEQLRKKEKAYDMYIKATEMEPLNPAIWESFGNYYHFNRQDRGKALEYYDQALKLSVPGTESAWLFIHRGIALRDLGRTDEARGDLEKARAIVEPLQDQGALNRIKEELARFQGQ